MLRLAFARRAAAAARLAFWARADRWAGVIAAAARAPPIRPPFAPCCRKYSSTSAGNRFAAIRLS